MQQKKTTSYVLSTFIILFFLLSSNLQSHPIHLSYTKIHIEHNRVAVICKIYSHDFDFISLPQQPKKTLATDFSRMLFYSYNQTVSHFSLDSLKKDDEIHWLYLHAYLDDSVSSFYIHNAILCNVYEDQQNLCIVSVQNKETGHILTCSNKKILISL